MRNLESFKQIVENSPYAVLVVDPLMKKIVYANPSAGDFFHESMDDFLRDEDKCKLLSDSVKDREISISTNRGERVGAVSVKPITWDRKYDHLRIIYIYDITARVEAETNAYIDELTKIPRRKLFETRITEAIGLARENKGMIALLYIDLDRFKPVNDLMGHQAGDRVLQIVARRIKSCIREGDTVGRMGGDEFGVILLNLRKPENAALVARKIVKALEQDIKITKDKTAMISASVGISLFPDDGADMSTLLQNADRAMYVAKQDRKGTGYRFYSHGIDDQFQKEQQIELGIRRAIRRPEEIQVKYMPQIDLLSGFISAVEALTYWQPPGEGLKSPAEFIKIAEKSGAIIPLEQIVFKKACDQVMHWRSKLTGTPPFRLAVNLSGNHFADQGFMLTIDELLQSSGLKPGLLDIELTESTMWQDPKAIEILEQLARKQLSITLDNFGSQEASMLSLKRFNITSIKIDKTFVQSLSGRTDRAIVRSIIRLAKEIGLRVIAQGVETRDQLKSLTNWGCDEVQGFFISRPLAIGDFETFVKSHVPEDFALAGEVLGAP